jgi:hypothetical protein
MIVLNSLAELAEFNREFSARVERPKEFEVVIPCASDRALRRLGRKTVQDDLSDREVVGIMRMMVPPHSKRSQHVRVF